MFIFNLPCTTVFITFRYSVFVEGISDYMKRPHMPSKRDKPTTRGTQRKENLSSFMKTTFFVEVVILVS